MVNQYTTFAAAGNTSLKPSPRQVNLHSLTSSLGAAVRKSDPTCHGEAVLFTWQEQLLKNQDGSSDGLLLIAFLETFSLASQHQQ